MQIGKALDRFLVQLDADGRSPHTIGQYRRHVRLLAEWAADMRVEDFGHEDLARFLASPAATQISLRAHLSRFADRALATQQDHNSNRSQNQERPTVRQSGATNGAGGFQVIHWSPVNYRLAQTATFSAAALACVFIYVDRSITRCTEP